jgi:hypothetical protein
MHGIVRDACQYSVRLVFKLWNGIFNHDCLNAVFAEQLYQIAV